MMVHFLLKRLLVLPFLVLGTATIVFFGTRLLPGDPVVLLVSPSFPPELTQRLHTEFGLDRNLGTQYLLWLRGMFTGSFGSSFTYHRDVISVIGDALPYTITLALCCIVAEIIGGVLLAVTSARSRSAWIGRMLSAGFLLTYTLPTFFVAFILLQIFSYRLGMFPSSHILSVNAGDFTTPEYFVDYVRHLILPVATLSIPGAAGIARFLRTSILAVQDEKYITVARSMGINDRRIFFSYVLPNAVSPLISVGGLELGSLLTGSLITETIFALPGMGRLIVTGIFSRDYPLIVGCTFTVALIYICVNLCTDIVHRLIDPRAEAAHD
jgi:peptide/nickel transport system permease protein